MKSRLQSRHVTADPEAHRAKRPAMRAFDAGALAGRRWVASAEDSAGIARLRRRFRVQTELDNWEPISIYACFLTDRYLVDGDNLLVPMKEAESLGRVFWCSQEGWPRSAAQRSFVAGFVRAAAAESP